MRIVFHIGLHKTGTTYLQKVVFPKLFAGENYLYKSKAILSLRNKSFHSKKINILSEENWSNSIRKPEEGWDQFSSFVESAEQLKKNYDVKIIIILRKHIDYVWSAYLHELKMGRNKSKAFEEYVNSFVEKGLSWTDRIKSMSNFDILVLDYQDMQENIDVFINRIAEFTGAQTKPNSIFKKSNQSNITPATIPEMTSCQKFEKSYQYMYNNVKRFTGFRPPTETLRVYIRDKVINHASLKATDAQKIQRPDIPRELKDMFDSDWETVWLLL